MTVTTATLAAILAVTPMASFAQGPQGAMLELADKLDGCEAYTQSVSHPFTGDSLTKEIVGITDGKCLYLEGMPNGGTMECRFTEPSRTVMAQFYRDSVRARSFGSETTLSSDDSEPEATYTIDGEEVTNPLQQSMNNGACVISGY